jgi:hypothetical protein
VTAASPAPGSPAPASPPAYAAGNALTFAGGDGGSADEGSADDGSAVTHCATAQGTIVALGPPAG